MKYLYIVAGLILVILGIAGVTLLKPRYPLSKEGIRVNERVITAEEVEKAYQESCALSPVAPERRRFIEDLVTKEVLLQEAKRRGLDLEEPFRRSIQNYYEQTLLKNLARKRMSEIKVSVSEEEIASYYSNMGKVYELRIVLLPTDSEARKAIADFPSEKAERRMLRPDEIPSEILDAVLSLKPGEVSGKPVACDRGFYVFKLEGFRMEPVPPLSNIHDEIRSALEDRKKKSEMEKWLEDLKKKSAVTINERLLKEGL